jgi:hypothetical protein
MTTARYSHNATVLSDGRVLVNGGVGAAGVLSSSELYEVTLGSWSPASALISGRGLHAATRLSDGSVLVSGGIISGAITSAELYSMRDITPPQVSCNSADGAWHNSNVTVLCSASDTGSGLANPADASFSLETDFPDGAESANAFTTSRQVCDQAGNCATAGPVGGNKIDKQGPTVFCAVADEAWHASDVAISCSAADAGSGLANVADAAFILTTNVAIGTESADVSTIFRDVCDSVGHCAPAGPISGNKIDKKAPTITVARHQHKARPIN